MKQLVFCLFAVCSWYLVDMSSVSDRIWQRRKLHEVRKELKVVRDMLKDSTMMLTTPPENIEECCCLSALRCFRDNFKNKFNTTETTQKRFYKSLNNSLTEKGLDFCDPRNSNCQDCKLHPQKNVGEFFSRLDTLLQKALSKLRVK